MQIVDRVLFHQFQDRLDRRYASHVRQIAVELGVPTRGRKLDVIKSDMALKLASGDFPHVVIARKLFG